MTTELLTDLDRAHLAALGVLSCPPARLRQLDTGLVQTVEPAIYANLAVVQRLPATAEPAQQQEVAAIQTAWMAFTASWATAGPRRPGPRRSRTRTRTGCRHSCSWTLRTRADP